jgi:adenine-specific DNA-methyltransferase
MEHPNSLRALAYFDELYPLDPGNAESKMKALPRTKASARASGVSPAYITRSHMTLPLPDVSHRYGDVKETKSGGVTYTPRELADFVADQTLKVGQLPTGRVIRLLDPAVGHGELLCAMLSRLPGDVEVFGFETDSEALEVATNRIATEFPKAGLNLVEGSFLDHVIDDFSGGYLSSAQPYDLIIANPPYVRTQIIGAERAQLLARQFGLSGRVDLYHAFLLGMATVLDSKGAAGIIVSNRFMTTKAGASTRGALLRELRLRRIFDLGDTKLFDAAVLPAVLIGRGQAAIDEVPEFYTIYETQDQPDREVVHPIHALAFEGVSEITDRRRFRVAHGRLDNGGADNGIWRLGLENVDAWLANVARRTWRIFGDIGKIRVGVKTTADKIFLPKVWDEDLELHRTLTTHHVARRFKALPLTRKILYPHQTVDGRRRAVSLDRYPRSRAYLESHRASLESRTYVIEAGRAWYEIWVPQNPDEWQLPKLVFRDISEKPTFWMDSIGSVVNGDCYWLTAPKHLLWLALAVANSTFIEQFYDHRFNNKLYAGRRRFITQYVEQFPLPDPDTQLGTEIIEMAKRVYEFTPSVEGDSLEAELAVSVSVISSVGSLPQIALAWYFCVRVPVVSSTARSSPFTTLTLLMQSSASTRRSTYRRVGESSSFQI